MKKKVIVVGATGTIGTAVSKALAAANYEVVHTSRNGPVRVNLDDPGSIKALFTSIRDVDAVICVAASVKLTPLAQLSDEDIALGLKSKLLGQIALLRCAANFLNDGGSVTLTGGTFKEPLAGSALGALVNAGLEGFVRAAALELPRGLRVNLVSPGWVKETLAKLDMDSTAGTAVSVVAHAYVEAVEGVMQGQTIIP